jgi:hypothetical protein
MRVDDHGASRGRCLPLIARMYGKVIGTYFLSVVLVGCSPNQRVLPVHDNNWIVGQLNARMGGIPDVTTGGSRDLHYLVRPWVNGEEIICGWTGFATRIVNGVPTPPNESAFIFRRGRLFLSQDMPPQEYDQLQDQLCGAQWIKPRPSSFLIRD